MTKLTTKEFREVQENNPNLSNFTCLGRAISGKKLSHAEILKLIRKLVPKSDYPGADAISLVTHLYSMSQICPRKAPPRGLINKVD